MRRSDDPQQDMQFRRLAWRVFSGEQFDEDELADTLEDLGRFKAELDDLVRQLIRDHPRKKLAGGSAPA